MNELLGADYTEHNILHGGIGMEMAVEILKHIEDDIDLDLEPTGKNLGDILVIFSSTKGIELGAWSKRISTHMCELRQRPAFYLIYFSK